MPGFMAELGKRSKSNPGPIPLVAGWDSGSLFAIPRGPL